MKRSERFQSELNGGGLLDEFLQYFEGEARLLDSQSVSHTMAVNSSFTSAITFSGRPILPPVMTDERFEEMAMYKRQAIFTEARLKARSRQKLLSRIQSIMNSIGRRSSPDTSTDTGLVVEGDVNAGLLLSRPEEAKTADIHRDPLVCELPEQSNRNENISPGREASSEQAQVLPGREARSEQAQVSAGAGAGTAIEKTGDDTVKTSHHSDEHSQTQEKEEKSTKGGETESTKQSATAGTGPDHSDPPGTRPDHSDPPGTRPDHSDPPGTRPDHSDPAGTGPDHSDLAGTHTVPTEVASTATPSTEGHLKAAVINCAEEPESQRSKDEPTQQNTEVDPSTDKDQPANATSPQQLHRCTEESFLKVPEDGAIPQVQEEKMEEAKSEDKPPPRDTSNPPSVNTHNKLSPPATSTLESNPNNEPSSVHDSSYTTTEDSLNSEGESEDFEGLTSGSSLLSRVAFTVEEEEGGAEEEKTQVKIGHLSHILTNHAHTAVSKSRVEDLAVPAEGDASLRPGTAGLDDLPRAITDRPDIEQNNSPHHETTDQNNSPHRETTDQNNSPHHETTDQNNSPHRETTDQNNSPHRETTDQNNSHHHETTDQNNSHHHETTDQNNSPHRETTDQNNSHHHETTDQNNSHHHETTDQNNSLPHQKTGQPPVSEEVSLLPGCQQSEDAAQTEKLHHPALTPGLDVSVEKLTPNTSDCSPEQLNKSENTSTLYTASTELDKYMAGSMDTLKSSLTTLPHLLDEPAGLGEEEEEEETPVQTPAIDTVRQVTIPHLSPNTDIRGRVTVFTPPAVSQQDKMEERSRSRERTREDTISPTTPVPKPVSSSSSPRKSVPTSSEVLRRGSYTLASPSPALLEAMEGKTDGQRTALNPLEAIRKLKDTVMPETREEKSRSDLSKCATQDRQACFELTSSMEDLKLKPVQRTLNFDEMSVSTQAQSVPPHEVLEAPAVHQAPVPAMAGKEEHLQRYLQTLSQMPQILPHQVSQSTNSPGGCEVSQRTQSPRVCEAGSQASSPGQVTCPSSSVSMAPPGGSLSESVQVELEVFQAQMLEQQQQQLAEVLMEQQRQQLRLQEEFMQHEAMLLQQSSRSSPLDDQLLLHLQDKQSQLLQHQLTMQHQLRQQMQQQQREFQMQLKNLKNTRTEQKGRALRPLPSLDAAPPPGGRRRPRRKWQDQKKGWPDLEREGGGSPHQPASLDSDQLSADSMRITELSSSAHPHSPHSHNHPHHLASNHDHKKRVSFSTDVDTLSTGSVHSRSTSRTTSRSGVYTDSGGGAYYRVGGQLYPVPSIDCVKEVAECLETSQRTNSPSSPASSGSHSARSNRMSPASGSRSSRTSPKVPRHVVLSGPKLSVHDEVIPPGLHVKFTKVSAAVKGYLTRRLMRSDKVQNIIKTITDTAEFAIKFQRESPAKNGRYTSQDRELVERVLAQLTSALYEIHEIFFEIPVSERLHLISQTRAKETEQRFKQQAEKKAAQEKRLSAATLKARERKKKAKAAERAVFGDTVSKSPSTSSPFTAKHKNMSRSLRRNYGSLMSRVMRTNQAHLSPIKPVKDTLNRAVASQENSEKSGGNSERRSVTRGGGSVTSRKTGKTGVHKMTDAKKAAPSGNHGTNNKKAQTLRPKSTPPSTHPWK